MRFNPKSLNIRFKIAEHRFMKKQCLIVLQILKSDFEQALIFADFYDKKQLSLDWKDFCSHIKEHNPSGRKIKISSAIITENAKKNNLKISPVATVDKVIITDEAVSIVTYAEQSLLIDYSTINIYPHLKEDCYRPDILSATFVIYRQDFFKAIKEAGLPDDEDAWESFIGYLNLHYNVESDSPDTLRLNAHKMQEVAAKHHLSVLSDTTVVEHVHDNEDSLEISISVKCVPANEKQAIHQITVTPDFEWTPEHLSQLAFSMPIPSARTKHKNIKLTFAISFCYFQKLLKKANLCSEHDQMLFNKFAHTFQNSVNDIKDLASFSLSLNDISETISAWGYITSDISLRHTPELLITGNDIQDITFTITTKSVLDAPDDESDEEIIKNMTTHILQPHDYAERKDYAYISCYISYPNFRHALESLHLYNPDTIKRTWRYLARQLNNSIFDYPLFYEDWHKEMRSIAPTDKTLAFAEIEPYSVSLTDTYLSFIAKYNF